MNVETATGLALLLVGPATVAGFLALVPVARRPLLGLLAASTCHIQRPWFKDLFFVSYRGVDRGFGVTIPDLLFLGMGLYHKRLETRVRTLPTSSSELEQTYQRISATWLKKALPDF